MKPSREIKFRVWDNAAKEWLRDYEGSGGFDLLNTFVMGEWGDVLHKFLLSDERRPEDLMMTQDTGLKDKDGKSIYAGDILEFSDKWEWYRSSYGIKMMFANAEERKALQEQFDAEPTEKRVVKLPEGYSWLLSSEIQQYWVVIGNIYEHPNLLEGNQ